MVDKELDTVWVASRSGLDQARFIRQKLFPALLTAQAKALINMVGAVLWIMDTEDSDSKSGQWQKLPKEYTDVDLYHVRMDRLIHREDILGSQGIQDGDVLVFISGDSNDMNRQLERIRTSADSPATVPAGIPEDVTSISASDLKKTIDYGST